MSVTVESTATAVGSGSTLTITKPTGLVVGDLLVFVASASHAVSATIPTISTKSGWTLADSEEIDWVATNIQYKVADSSDVAASSFAFTFSVVGNCVGALLRCSSYGASVVQGFYSASTNAASPTTSISLGGTASVPEGIDGSLVVCALAASETKNSRGANMSNYGSTPSLTWTELYDHGETSGNDIGAAGIYAIQTTGVNITNITADLAIGELESQSVTVVVIRDNYPSSGTNALLSVSPTTFSQAGRADTNGTSDLLEVSPTIPNQSGEGIQPTVWTPTNKS